MTLSIQKFLSSFSRIRSMDWILFFSVFTLICLGMSAIYSVDLSRDAIDLTDVRKQSVALVVAFIIMAGVLFSNYKFLEHYHFVFYLAGLILLVGVLFLGHTIRGARGWYVFGFASFQPVEFMKAALIVALSTYFGRHARRYFGWKEFLQSFGLAVVPAFVTLLQPDFGSAVVLMGIWFVMALFAGMRMKQLYILIIGAFIALVFSWFVLFAPYQKARVMTFMNPTADPLGQGYNVAQAVIAIGAGGWFGRGLGFGTQSQLKFLPESHTDFIVAVIAEELGFFGMILLLGAFTLLLLRLFNLTHKVRDNFTAFLLLGTIAVIFLQVLVNIGMNLGIFPVTGLGLPFVSYGGSSIVFFLFLIGIAQSISIRTVHVVS